MDINYKEMISFSRLKELLQERGIKVKEFAETLGIASSAVSGFITSHTAFPLTDAIAKICYCLKVPVSEICVFKGIEISPYFRERELFYKPSEDSVGEVTYRPLRRFLENYLENHPDKTADDLYDKIEPARRRNGQVNKEILGKNVRKALLARGITADYEVKEKRARRDYSKGLPYEVRTKLRRDRPLNIRVIYDICKYLGCSVDFVMSYK